MKRAWRNFWVLMRGRGAAAVLTIASTVIMASVLSPREFGYVVLMHTYVLVIRGVLQFKPFESVVRFGVPFQDAGDRFRLSSLLCLTRIVDVATSVAAALLAMALAPIAAGFIEWDAGMVEIATWYSLVLLVTGTGTAKGVLRLYDRFDALSWQLLVGPLVRFVGVSAAALLGAGMTTYMLVLALALVTANAYLVVRGRLEMRRQMAQSIWKGQSARTIFRAPGDFWRFSLSVYGQTQVDLINKRFNLLLVGALLGPAAAGLFRVAKNFSDVLAIPAVLLRQVLFPDLTRAWHQQDSGFRRNTLRVALSAGLGGFLLTALSVPVGAPLLSLIGAEYTAAAPLLTLLLMSAALELTGAPLRSAAYAMGKAGSVLRLYLFCTVLYLALFVATADIMGLTGPGIAAAAASACAVAGMLLIVRRSS